MSFESATIAGQNSGTLIWSTSKDLMNRMSWEQDGTGPYITAQFVLYLGPLSVVAHGR
jgi:hypothetical protein